MPPERDIISPEVQVMVDATRASTEQLANVNKFLAQISIDAAYIRNYLSNKDGLQKDLAEQKKELEEIIQNQIAWLWLKIAGAVTLPVAIVVAISEIIKANAGVP